MGSPKKINKQSKEYVLMDEIKALMKSLPKIQSSEKLKILEAHDDNTKESRQEAKSQVDTVILVQNQQQTPKVDVTN